MSQHKRFKQLKHENYNQLFMSVKVAISTFTVAQKFTLKLQTDNFQLFSKILFQHLFFNLNFFYYLLVHQFIYTCDF